jgi:hypothetical protein
MEGVAGRRGTYQTNSGVPNMALGDKPNDQFCKDRHKDRSGASYDPLLPFGRIIMSGRKAMWNHQMSEQADGAGYSAPVTAGDDPLGGRLAEGAAAPR